ncbi:MAG TPA: glucose-6-phosphate dehydrogenase, partial [Actinomycetota bacterium]|nr:glucose-6-phosphate dehydrogenase [Actinomycetota bacterium]
MKEKLTPPDPQAIVIFGASGDLAHRKLLPALYHLFAENLLPTSFAIVGYSRTAKSDEEFAEEARAAVEKFGRTTPDDEPWAQFAKRLSYLSGDFATPGAMADLREHLSRLDREAGTEGGRFFYCATPPEAFSDVISRLREERMAGDDSRIVIEKPFGTDLDSARELNRLVHEVFQEGQIFRIDHYLGKETVQNILVLRFANMIFEPLWNRSYIDSVQITAAEDIGIGSRAG